MADQTQVVAGRNIIVYTEPWATANNFPSDSILWGTAWGGAWVDKGYTRGGLRVRMNVQRANILVDQVVDPVLRIPQQRDLQMITNLAQLNASNLADATGQGSVTANGATMDLDVSGVIVDQYLTTGFDVLNPGDNKAMRVVGWKGFVQGDVELAFNVTEAAQIAFTVNVVPDTSSVPARLMKYRDIN